MANEPVLQAVTVAASVIAIVYEWTDQIEAAGGTTSLAGVAKCNAFLNTLKQNRERINTLVLEPLITELEKEYGQ